MMPKQWGFNRSWAGSEFVPGSGPSVVGLSDLRTLDVSGGRVLFATVDAPGAYSLRVEPKR